MSDQGVLAECLTMLGTTLHGPPPGQPNTLWAMVRDVCVELEAARRFKAYVHQRLDAAGIPTHSDGPHGKEGCRIGDRLDIALGSPKWVPVGERLPKPFTHVLAVSDHRANGGGIATVEAHQEPSGDWLQGGTDWPLRAVTHWMPLPAPPTVK